MLEPIYYDIGRICKETYYQLKKNENNKDDNLTPKMIDKNTLKNIEPPLLKIPFDCPEDIANCLIEMNKEENHEIIKINDREIRYYIINFGKYIDNIKFEELNKDKLPKLKPVLKWQSQNGKIVELYDINKAKKIINEMNKRGLSRIIYLDDLVVK